MLTDSQIKSRLVRSSANSRPNAPLQSKINQLEVVVKMGRLTAYDRERIEHWVRLGLGVREIARRVGRDHSVVSRELDRNRSPHFAYEASKAEYFSTRRAKKTNKRKLFKSAALRDYVVGKLHLGWSPEQIAGRIKAEKPAELVGLEVSYEAIYQFIYEEEPWLYHRLRRKKPVRRYQRARQPQQLKIPERISIHARPELINNRSQIGHFESDTVVGRGHKGYLSVQYERAIQLVRISSLRGLKAEQTTEALRQTVESLPPGFVRSITFDNGTENTKHTKIKQEYNIPTYFCDPAAPYQKGGVENVNGLIRQYFPKWRDLSSLTDQEIQKIQERINNRPRKKLNYQTPNEMLQQYQSGALNS